MFATDFSAHLIRRIGVATSTLLAICVTLWFVYTLLFFALRVLPGDAISAAMLDSGASADMIAVRRAALHLDAPLLQQYIVAGAAVLRGDLGVSLIDGHSVIDTIWAAAGHTFALAGAALLCSLVIGIPLGALADHVGWRGRIARLLIGLGLSLPVYWTGTALIVLFSVWLGWLPSSGSGRLEHLVLPALALGWGGAASLAQGIAGDLMQYRTAPFIVAARARGIPEWRLFWRHRFPLALPVLIAVVGVQAGYVLGGVVITEAVFSRPGMGRLLLDAVLRQDYPVVQGIVLYNAVIIVVLHRLCRVAARQVDPRTGSETG